jgi:hypothetical protein
MLNIFGYRATDRRVMKRVCAPVAPAADPRANDQHLRREVARIDRRGGIVVAAWGIDGAHLERSAAVRALLAPFPLYRLSLTRSAEPGHPLYLKGDLKPIRWVGSAQRDTAKP